MLYYISSEQMPLKSQTIIAHTKYKKANIFGNAILTAQLTFEIGQVKPKYGYRKLICDCIMHICMQL